jgi:zinc protease
MLDRTVPPASHPLLHFDLPSYEKLAFHSDANCYIVRDEKLPVVQIEFLFESGKSSQSVVGTSYYAIKMLPEGSVNKSADEIANGFESLGSFVEFGSGIDHCFIKVYAQSHHVLPTLELLEEVICNPRFDNEAYKALQQIRAQQIAVQLSKNTNFATLKFNELLFGSEHPFGAILSPEGATELPLSKVVDFYHERLFFNPKIFVTGMVDDELISKIKTISHYFTSSDHKSHNQVPLPQYGSYKESRTDSEQTSLRMGMHTISKSHPDIHKLSISNTLLGGYFGSRLMKTIREELGYTYGIYSSIIHSRNYSYWLLSSELVKEHSENGLKQIQKQLTKLSETFPDDKELAILKNYLRGKLLSSVDSIFSKGGLIKNLVISELDDNHYNQYLDSIDSLTPQDISRTISTYLLEQEKTTLLVG